MMEYTNGDPTWLSVAPSDGSAPAIRVSDIYSGGIGTHYQWAPDDSTITLLPNVGPLVLLDPAGGPTVDAALDDRRGRVLAAPRALTSFRGGRAAGSRPYPPIASTAPSA